MLTFDAYIRLRDTTEQVETIEVSPELHIDIASDVTIYCIELLNANQQLAGDRHSSLLVTNEALGETTEIKLSP